MQQKRINEYLKKALQKADKKQKRIDDISCEAGCSASSSFAMHRSVPHAPQQQQQQQQPPSRQAEQDASDTMHEDVQMPVEATRGTKRQTDEDVERRVEPRSETKHGEKRSASGSASGDEARATKSRLIGVGMVTPRWADVEDDGEEDGDSDDDDSDADACSENSESEAACSPHVDSSDDAEEDEINGFAVNEIETNTKPTTLTETNIAKGRGE